MPDVAWFCKDFPFSTIDPAKAFAHRHASRVGESDHVLAHHVVPMTREEAANANREFPFMTGWRERRCGMSKNNYTPRKLVLPLSGSKF